MCTPPITTCETGCSVSALLRLKMNLHSIMGQESMNTIALITPTMLWTSTSKFLHDSIHSTQVFSMEDTLEKHSYVTLTSSITSLEYQKLTRINTRAIIIFKLFLGEHAPTPPPPPPPREKFLFVNPPKIVLVTPLGMVELTRNQYSLSEKCVRDRKGVVYQKANTHKLETW